jgi:hypothetical protein
MLNISNFVEAIKEYPWMNAFFVMGFLLLIISELTTLFNLRFHTLIRAVLHITAKRTAITNNKINSNINQIIKKFNASRFKNKVRIQDFLCEENSKLSENLLDLKTSRKIYREPNYFSTLNDTNISFSCLFLVLLFFYPEFSFIPTTIFSLSFALYNFFDVFLFHFTQSSHDDFLKLFNVEPEYADKSRFVDANQILIGFVLTDTMFSLGLYVYGLFLVPGVAKFFLFNFL